MYRITSRRIPAQIWASGIDIYGKAHLAIHCPANVGLTLCRTQWLQVIRQERREGLPLG